MKYFLLLEVEPYDDEYADLAADLAGAGRRKGKTNPLDIEGVVGLFRDDLTANQVFDVKVKEMNYDEAVNALARHYIDVAKEMNEDPAVTWWTIVHKNNEVFHWCMSPTELSPRTKEVRAPDEKGILELLEKIRQYDPIGIENGAYSIDGPDPGAVKDAIIEAINSMLIEDSRYTITADKILAAVHVQLAQEPTSSPERTNNEVD